MSSQAVVAALKAALESQQVAFGDGSKPKAATTRYVVAWFDSGRVTDHSLRSRDGLDVTGVFHSYGHSSEAARGVHSLLTAAILGLHRSELAGRTVQMPEQLTSLPLQRDDNLNPPLFDVVSEWRFPLTPA